MGVTEFKGGAAISKCACQCVSVRVSACQYTRTVRSIG